MKDGDVYGDVFFGCCGNKEIVIFRGKVINKYEILQEIMYHTWSWLKTYGATFDYSFVQWIVNPGACIRGQ